MKTYRRPMFRKGGSTGEGVMYNVKPRTNFQEGMTKKMIEDRAKLYRQYAGDPIANLLIQGGLGLISGEGAGKGTLGSVATAFQKPVTQALAQEQQIGLKAVGDVLAEQQAMRLADVKQRDKFKTLALFQTAKAQIIQEGNLNPSDLEIQQRAGNISKQAMQREETRRADQRISDIKSEFTIAPTTEQAQVIDKFRRKVKPKLDKSEIQLGRQTIKNKDIKEGKASKKSAGVYINIDSNQVVRVDQNGTVVVDEALTALLDK